MAKPKVILSIGIPSLSTRPKFLSEMLGNLDRQIGVRQDVELFVLCDNASISIGRKMNLLMEMMTGEYVCFLGDDDRVTDDFVDTLIDAIKEHGTDCVSYNMEYIKDGRHVSTIREGAGFRRERGNRMCLEVEGLTAVWTGPASCKMPMRRELVAPYKYNDISFGEDAQFMAWVNGRLTTDHHIERTLYTYDYNSRSPYGKRFQKMRGRA